MYTPHRARSIPVLLSVLSVLSVSLPTAHAGRYESLTAWAAKGPKMKLAAATFFGGAGTEGFVDAAQMKDGSILACGNAYGPAFTSVPKAEILGQGSHGGSQAVTADKKGRKKLNDYTPDASGFIVVYSSTLQRINRVVKFNWGVATIRAVALSQDGKALILSGYCSSAKIEALMGGKVTFKQHQANVVPDRRGRTKTGPAPAYVMRMVIAPGQRTAIEWCWVLDKYQAAPEQLWQDKTGAVYFGMNGFTRISPDGTELKKISEKGSTGGQNGIRGLDPGDGGYFYGGDRNTNTGKEPWRQPFLYKYNDKGEKIWSLWGWSPKGLRDGKGTDDGLVSDSSIRGVTVAPNGDLIMAGWSDGGNSVFTRQPYDVEKSSGKSRGPFTTWGMRNANSLAYLLRIDPKTFHQKAWSYWVSYVPDTFADRRYRGAPNAASIKDLEILENDLVAFNGGAATGLISTPNAFYKHKGPNKYGGSFVAVAKEDFSELRFSSYLPGYKVTGMAPVKDGLVVVGTTAKDDGKTNQDPTPPPIVNAIQKEFGGGAFDGHIILLRNPGAR